MTSTFDKKAPPLPDGSRNRNPADIGFWALVREDFRTHGRNIASQGFWAVFWHRFGNVRMGWPRALRPFGTVVYEAMRVWTQVVCGIKLDYTVLLGRRVRIEHFGGIVIGARSIGDDVVIRQNTTLGIRSLDDLNAKPMIGSRVEIGAGAVIVGHVSVGSDSVIGANCVVACDVPPQSFVRPPRPEIVPRQSGPAQAEAPVSTAAAILAAIAHERPAGAARRPVPGESLARPVQGRESSPSARGRPREGEPAPARKAARNEHRDFELSDVD